MEQNIEETGAEVDEVEAEEVLEVEKDGGFTIIELLVAIVVIGILSATTVLAVGGLSNQAQASSCDTDFRNVSTAVALYESAAGTAPENMAALVGDYIEADRGLHVVENGLVAPVDPGPCA